MYAAGGGYRSPITSEDGYQLRLTPKCLGINVDHRPVIHRPQQSLPAGADKSSGAPLQGAQYDVGNRRSSTNCSLLPYASPGTGHSIGIGGDEGLEVMVQVCADHRSVLSARPVKDNQRLLAGTNRVQPSEGDRWKVALQGGRAQLSRHRSPAPKRTF
jgi:hypothetical protein